MQTGKILLSAVVATSAMTVFSYLISKSKNKNFREPDLVGKLMNRLSKNESKTVTQIAGWGIHYAIGITFVAFYHLFWKQKEVKPSVISGTLLGAASGIIGVLGWTMMFEAHPNPPAKKLKPFFGHLMLAHMVFGAFSAITHRFTYGHKRS